MKCGIYTRKSSQEGLEQDFNSLAAQREACESYIVSQRSEGWRSIKTHYDDGGISGGTLERPGLKALLADIEVGHVDIVVIYKIDRLTRSLTDFAKLIDQFDAQGISVVAVTQPFNTTTSMGRLTLNVLLSFAQFEREITGERIRDKIAASKQKGMWMGGVVPLGYDVDERQLTINPEEAKLVNHIFARYQSVGSVRVLKEDLDRTGMISKTRISLQGKVTKGKSFSRGALYTLLRNPLYIGKIRQGGSLYEGQHTGIVETNVYLAVQKTLDEKRVEHKTRGNSHSLLAGILYDAEGHRMSPSHTKRHKQKYRYYVSQQVLYGGKSTTLNRISAHEVEQAVVESLITILQEPLRIINRLNNPSAHMIEQLNEMLHLQQSRLKNPKTQSTSFRGLVQRIDLAERTLSLSITLKSLFNEVGVDHVSDAIIQVKFPVRIARCQHGKKLVLEGEQKHKEPDKRLVHAINNAHQWNEALQAPDIRGFSTLANKLSSDAEYVSRIHNLIFLAPDIQLAILEGLQPPDLTLDRLSKHLKMPLCFAEQRKLYGFASDSKGTASEGTS